MFFFLYLFFLFGYIMGANYLISFFFQSSVPNHLMVILYLSMVPVIAQNMIYGLIEKKIGKVSWSLTLPLLLLPYTPARVFPMP